MRSTPLAYSKGGTRCTAARIPEERCDGFASGALVLDEAALHEWLGRVGSFFVPLRSHATRLHSSCGDRRQCSDEQRTRFDLTVTTSERPQWLRLQGTLAASAAAQGEGDLQLSGTQPWAVSGMDKDSHCSARSSRTLLTFLEARGLSQLCRGTLQRAVSTACRPAPAEPELLRRSVALC
jgi:hypothetical protein